MKKVPYALRTIGLLALGRVTLTSCSNPADFASEDDCNGNDWVNAGNLENASISLSFAIKVL